nr:hypothetical protein [Myxococcota bacterium]
MSHPRFSFLALALVVACDCSSSSGGGPGDPCEVVDDCASGLICLDDACRPAPDTDGGPRPDSAVPDGGVVACEVENECGGGRLCCAEGEECVDDFACSPVCENARCGDNRLTCCAAGQVCLDGVVCAASCAEDRALCGASLDVCCQVGEVCVEDACVAPGAECGDDFDCLEEGTYCEPTIGRCLTNPSPPLCEVRPDFEDVSLEIEW